MTVLLTTTGRLHKLRSPVTVEGRAYSHLFLRRGSRRDLRSTHHRLTDESVCTMLMARLARVPRPVIDALTRDDQAAVLDHVEWVLRNPPA